MSFATGFQASRPFSTARTDPSVERGWALVSTLWAITMLALMAAATETLTATSYRAEAHAITAARAEAAADAAVVRAVLGITDIRPGSRWRADGQRQRFWFKDVPVEVSVQGELGRVDMNTASGPLIRQLLIGSGVSLDTATKLTDRIVAWRSTTGLENLKATDDDYASLPYRPRHGPFQTVDEIRLVRGMTPALFAKIAPAITVYSKRQTLDESIAPREALRALYPDDDTKIDAILRLRESTAAIPQPPRTGQAFSIEATSRVGNRSFRRSAVVQVTGSDTRPYYVLHWQ
jgi:general secretion pathway protein K